MRIRIFDTQVGLINLFFLNRKGCTSEAMRDSAIEREENLSTSVPYEPF